MLAEFRAAVVDVVTAAALVDVWPTIPDDVTAVPCIVVGMPTASPARETAVFDRDLVVYVIGRRVDADDPETELVGLADDVFDLFGGSRGVKYAGPAGGEHLMIDGLEARNVTIAGVDHPAYLITLTSPVATC